MGKKLWGPNDIAEFIASIATATVKPCKEAGTVEIHSSTTSKFEGGYIGSRSGDIVINVDAGVDVPTEPVDADAKVGWIRKAIGEKSHKIYVTYYISASTHPPEMKDPLPPVNKSP